MWAYVYDATPLGPPCCCCCFFFWCCCRCCVMNSLPIYKPNNQSSNNPNWRADAGDGSSQRAALGMDAECGQAGREHARMGVGPVVRPPDRQRQGMGRMPGGTWVELHRRPCGDPANGRRRCQAVARRARRERRLVRIVGQVGPDSPGARAHSGAILQQLDPRGGGQQGRGGRDGAAGLSRRRR